MKFWQITSLEYDLATSSNFLNAERLLSKEPEIQFCDTLETWQSLGPLTITEILSKSGIEYHDFSRAGLIFEEKNLNNRKISKSKNQDHIEFSMIESGSYQRQGICRVISFKSKQAQYIKEGMYQHGLLNGYGRIINHDGSYFTGMFSDDKYDGQGDLIEKNGTKYTGMFREGRKEG